MLPEPKIQSNLKPVRLSFYRAALPA